MDVTCAERASENECDKFGEWKEHAAGRWKRHARGGLLLQIRPISAKTSLVNTPGLEQGMSQSMVATASMQLFMKALQATQAELSQMAVQALSTNPALEEVPPSPDAEFPPEVSFSAGSQDGERHDFLMDSLCEEPSLLSHLEEQIRRSALAPEIERAALLLIQHLDERGYLDMPSEDIAREERLMAPQVKEALRAVQDLDPPGVGATDLRESLMLQLRRLGEEDSLSMLLLKNHWEELIRHRYGDAARALQRGEEEVAAAARRLARLNPNPGSAFSQAEKHTITPDLLVTREGDELTVRLTEVGIPRLALSSTYRDMMATQADKPELRRYLSRCFREGRELIRALRERQQTILNIARALVVRQRAFFLRGPGALAPLRMEDIAADTGYHTSTISRACRGKYLRCDYGIRELRSFFTAALPSGGGESISAEVIQKRIRDYIRQENPSRPLSDARLEATLAKEGIRIARRTIAKYREQMHILPAHLRKK